MGTLFKVVFGAVDVFDPRLSDFAGAQPRAGEQGDDAQVLQ